MTYIEYPGIKGKVYNAKEFSPIKMLTHKNNKPKTSYRSDTEFLNQIFDKLFEFVKLKSEAD